jgi:MoaA/NifB/PqqE/SkfB family radical SAM enzyme
VGWGYLTKENFERILDLNPEVERVELSNWGEIMLNPHIELIIRCAHRRGITLTARNGVNFNHVSRSVLVAMVECEFRHLTISIDGATQEVYSMFRRGGDLDHVLNNIRELNCLKAANQSTYPELRWQFIAFGHNEHEIELARSMAARLGMDFYVKLNATADYSPVKNVAEVAKLSGTGASSRAEYRQRTGRPYALPCTQLFNEPQVNWNGVVLGCCRNSTVALGNAFASSIEECQRGERYLKTMRIANGADENPSDTPCRDCGIYRTEILPYVTRSPPDS